MIIDGSKAQRKALNPKWKDSIHSFLNNADWATKMLIIPCLCHKINNYYIMAAKRSEILLKISKNCIVLLIWLCQWHVKEIGKKCPTHVSTRWIFDYNIVKFIVEQNQIISTFAVISEEIKEIKEVLFILKSLTLTFENPKTKIQSLKMPYWHLNNYPSKIIGMQV